MRPDGSRPGLLETPASTSPASRPCSHGREATALVVGGGGGRAGRRSRAAALRRTGDAGSRRGALGQVPELEAYAAEGSIAWERREFEDADLEGKFMAIAATNDTDVNIAVYDDAERAGDARQRRRRAAALQLHPPGDRPHRPAGDRDLHRGRLAGAGQAHEARDRRALRRALRPPRDHPQRRPRLGEGHAAHLPGPQGVLRGDRQRRPRPDRAPARGPRPRGGRAGRGARRPPAPRLSRRAARRSRSRRSARRRRRARGRGRSRGSRRRRGWGSGSRGRR